MERTQIYLSSGEQAALDRASRETGRSKSDLIREAIDRVYLSAADDFDRVLATTFGGWKRREGGEAFAERSRPGRLARLHGVGH